MKISYLFSKLMNVIFIYARMMFIFLVILLS